MNSRPTARILPLLAAAAALAISVPALAQHSGGGHGGGGGGGHGGGAHSAVGHAAYGGRGAGYGGHYYYGGGGHGGYAGGGWRGGGYRGGWYGGGWRGGYWGWGLGAGLFFAALPLYYSTYWWGGIPYYYADNTYYVYNSDAGAYETVAPPQGLVGSDGAPAPAPGEAPPAAAGGSTDVYMYPKAGQSPEVQARDRYECYRWAADQSGFDPAQANGAAGAAAAKRADYIRANTACLEGRNYSVR